jgi:hypothetical protein
MRNLDAEEIQPGGRSLRYKDIDPLAMPVGNPNSFEVTAICFNRWQEDRFFESRRERVVLVRDVRQVQAGSVPLVSGFLFNVAVQVYHRLPVLNALHATQAPMLVAALTIGTVFFIFTISLARWLAGLFSRAGIKSMER